MVSIDTIVVYILLGVAVVYFIVRALFKKKGCGCCAGCNSSKQKKKL